MACRGIPRQLRMCVYSAQQRSITINNHLYPHLLLQSHGSFLHRKKDVAKIAATKAVNNPNTSGMARQFVFQTMSPPKQEEDQIPPKVIIASFCYLKTSSDKRCIFF